MGRLSIRPRPLDIHKKLQIVKSVKEFEDDEVTTSLTRHSQILRLTPEAETEVNHARIKKLAGEIPTPQFVVVDTYERDYSQTFSQPASYLRGRGARADIGEFVEYDLDNEDEDWLERFNKEKQILTPDKFETILFKLEVLDHKARERAGVTTRTLGSPIPVLLQLDSAAEALQSLNVRYIALLPVYNYWKEKRERWQKPVLRRLQPRPPVHDTNPYNVFRPREKIHRAHTRRMQRRENNIQSFEKLRQVRRNFDQAKMVLETLIKREEKKRELVENEIDLQRIQLKYKNEVQLVEDGLSLPGFSLFSGRFGEEDDYADSDDMRNCNRPWARPAIPYDTTLADSKVIMVPAGCMKQDLKRHNLTHGWLLKEDPHEQVLLFTKPLLPERLAAAGIVPPLNPSRANDTVYPPYNFRGRIGRGGRIIFDRWNPLLRTPICQTSNP